MYQCANDRAGCSSDGKNDSQEAEAYREGQIPLDGTHHALGQIQQIWFELVLGKPVFFNFGDAQLTTNGFISILNCLQSAGPAGCPVR